MDARRLCCCGDGGGGGDCPVRSDLCGLRVLVQDCYDPNDPFVVPPFVEHRVPFRVVRVSGSYEETQIRDGVDLPTRRWELDAILGYGLFWIDPNAGSNAADVASEILVRAYGLDPDVYRSGVDSRWGGKYWHRDCDNTALLRLWAQPFYAVDITLDKNPGLSGLPDGWGLGAGADPFVDPPFPVGAAYVFRSDDEYCLCPEPASLWPTCEFSREAGPMRHTGFALRINSNGDGFRRRFEVNVTGVDGVNSLGPEWAGPDGVVPCGALAPGGMTDIGDPQVGGAGPGQITGGDDANAAAILAAMGSDPLRGCRSCGDPGATP